MSSISRLRPPIRPTPQAKVPRFTFSTLTHQARRLFHFQGYLLATHQIPALLFSSFLICSLLSPALLLYFSPEGGPTSAVMRRGRGEMIWELEGMNRQGVIWSEDEVCWDRLAAYYEQRGIGHRARLVRMEQILISPSASSASGALSKRTLHHTLQIQHELERRLLGGEIEGLTCVRDVDGTCAIASPASWWHSEAALLADLDVHRTLSLPSATASINSNDSLLPLTVSNTLVGIGRDRRGSVKAAHYLAMSFYLEDTSADLVLRGIGTRTEEEARERAKTAWRKAVREVVSGRGWETEMDALGTLRESRAQSRRIILKHLPHIPVHSHPRLLEDFLFGLGFLTVGLYVYFTMRRLHHVHSKIGLVLTGLVELAAVGIMSLSVCWLSGLGVALVPWKLIPFLVLVCGVDNMFLLIRAVGSTDIALPVPERVAVGLGSVGLPTTATLLTELFASTLLLRAISVQVIRELIIFAEVALVVDYFMEMTFFTTILSIDLQRLELADLLTQGTFSARPALATPSENGEYDPNPPAPTTSFATAIKSALRNRAARTVTMAFLFGINVFLYSLYGPDHYLPAFCSETALSSNRPLLGPSLSADFAVSLQRGRKGEVRKLEDVRPGAGTAFWQLINPANSSSVHIYIEPVSVVKFYDDGLAAPESAAADIVTSSMWFTAGLVIIPIAVTILVLYFLLVYLTKDAELLALQVQRRSTDQSKVDRKRVKGGAEVDLTALRGRHAADVEVLASSKDLVASWAGLDDQVIVWTTSKTGISSEVAYLEVPIAAEPPSLVLLALDSESKFCAATTMSGRLLIWSIERRLLLDFGAAVQLSVFGAATHLFSIPCLPRGALSPPGRTANLSAFYSVHQNGGLVIWDCVTCVATPILHPSSSTADNVRLRNTVLTPPSDSSSPSSPIYAQIHSNGRLVLYQSIGQATRSDWPEILATEVTTPSDPVTSLGFGHFILGASDTAARGFLVVGTLSGLISLYQLDDGGRICTLAELDGAVRQIRLAPARKSKCGTCGQLLSDGFNVICSTRTLVSILRVHASSSTCTCGYGSLRSPSSVSLSRSSSNNSRHVTPKKPRRSSRASTSEESPYPSPMHGFHLRKGSSSAQDRKKFEATSGLPPPRPDSAPLQSPSKDIAPFEETPTSSALPAPPSPSGLQSQDPPLIGVSPSLSDVQLFNVSREISVTGGNGDSARHWDDVHVLEAAITPADERGGWEVVGTKLIGVRRRKQTLEEKEARSTGQSRGPAWEVWSINLAPTSSTDAGHRLSEGSSSLEGLLATAGPSHSSTTSKASPSVVPDSSLRRRLVPASTASTAVRSNGRVAAVPTIRFEDINLPFSRARPVIPAMDEAAIAVGLGNTIALLSPHKGGAFGRLALPPTGRS